MSAILQLQQAPKGTKYSRLSPEQYSIYLDNNVGNKDQSVLLNGKYFQIVEKTGNSVKVICMQCTKKTTILSAGLDSTSNLLRHLRILPLATAWRRHRHKHGRRIPISNRLHGMYGRSWRQWERDERVKRQEGYYPDEEQPESGPWSDWIQMTGCSRTCGGGVFKEMRTCDIEGACSGNDRRYSSCNVQECPEDSIDFRAEQCARYNNVPFEEQYYSWIPYTKGPRQCELNCQPEGERFYYRHAMKVVDGTRCNAELRDVCVDGGCVPVGCDLIIGSRTKEDKCRVCGGDGSECTTISGVIDAPSLTVGYNDIVLIPVGATNIHIEEVQSSNNYLGLRNASGVYYLNGDWKIDFPNAMKFAGTTVHYERKLEGVSIFAPEVIRSLGPTNESLYLVLLYQEANPGIRYEFSIPKKIKEMEDIVYEWRMSGWGECSVSCGGGHMVRNISCVRASDFEAVDESLQLCDPRLRPESNKSCNEHPCQSSWQVGNWTPCTSECGTPSWQFRHVYCGQRVSEGRLAIINASSCEMFEGPKPEDMRECNVGISCPAWHKGDWSHCDRLCGDGHQYRKVICHSVTDTTTVMLEDDKCKEEKPENKKTCKAPPCTGVDWTVSEWTECKSSCGAAVKTRKAICITREGEVVPEVLCGAHRKPPLSEDCEEDPECKYRWYSSEWSECSEKCGKGLITRHVFCGQFEGEKIVSIAGEGKCDAEKRLPSNENCVGTEDCEKEWYTAKFGKCSKDCGGGFQKRLIFCFKNETNLSYTKCDKTLKPFEKEQCNAHACSEDELMGISKKEDEEDIEWCDEDEMYDDEIHVDETEIDKSDEMTKDTENATEISPLNFRRRKRQVGKDPSKKAGVLTVVGEANLNQIRKDYEDEMAAKSSGEGTGEGSGEGTGEGSGEGTGEGSGEGTGEGNVEGTEEGSAEGMGEGSAEGMEEGSAEGTGEGSAEGTGEGSAEGTGEGSAEGMEEGSTEGTGEGSTEEIEEGSTEGTGEGSTEGTGEGSAEGTGEGSAEGIEEGSTEGTGEGSAEGTGEGSAEGTGEGSAEEDEGSAVEKEEGSAVEKEEGSAVEKEEGSAVEKEEGSAVEKEEGSAVEKEEGSAVEKEEGSAVEKEEGSAVEKEEGSAVEKEEGSAVEKEEGSAVEKEEGSAVEKEEGSAVEKEEGSAVEKEAGSAVEKEAGSAVEKEEGSAVEKEEGSAVEKEEGSAVEKEEGSAVEKEEGIAVEKEDSSAVEKEESTEEEEEGSGEMEEVSTTPFSTEWEDVEEITTAITAETTTEKKPKKDKHPGKCKPRPKINCDETEFGCCRDGKTLAEGPFEEDCEVAETCEDTEYGCCPDDVSPAHGLLFLGCQGLAICDNSLFGCCPDNFTEAKGSNEEGCEELIEFNCEESRFGCCPDGVTAAAGMDLAGCEVLEREESGSYESCNETMYGCCPDGSTPATGEGFDGCLDVEESGEGSGTESPVEPPVGTATVILAECVHSPFGCCEDNFTAAHGQNFEGCCLASPFGCCPDHISNAKGPSFEGCGCEFSAFGCCPDNETVARGPDNAGCGCEFTEFGCCPDSHTPAVGANNTGCPCNTYEFGCCPDGISIAKGSNKEGCGCAYTEFGCCEDGRTPAEGPNNEGCGCEASQFGCCADGETAAQGELFEGCEEQAPIVPGEVCGFDKDRGTCRDFSMKYYFDIEYGGCARFWYGGCEGNLNRFESDEECQATCVEPEGLDACRLPAVAGPCTGSQPSWYHDSKTQSCQPFEYRGCLGNNNRYPTKEKCEEVCVIPEKTDICLLEVRPGPCRGNYSRWYYDQTVDHCRPFTFGGCKGNANNFLSEKECMQRCIRSRSQDICTLPKASGFCEETLPRWYFDYTENRCMPFYFTGCDGNANRFMSRGECAATCAHDEAESLSQNACTIPKSTGNCTNYEERYYYDLVASKCQQFLYGGCEGNENNFHSLEECQLACEDERIPTDPEKFPTESCFLDSDQGPCGEFTALWYYDSSDGACKQFLYSGCGGNLNRFKTRQECENKCGEVQDICQLPVVVGPCSGSFKQYYYDHTQDSCFPFDYSGCQGNRNRFDSLHLCQQRCQTKSPETSTHYPDLSRTDDSSRVEGPDEDLPAICNLPMYTGHCRAAFPRWYFDSSQGKCIDFTYGGCSGNANRFLSVEHCERQCGKYRNEDVCNEAVDAGSCGGVVGKWYHDPLERICKPFYYSGCAGNGNRFSSQSECESECIYHDTLLPKGNDSETNIAICELGRDFGPCSDGYKRWYFSTTTGICEGFVYGGCGGNQNRFKNFNNCMQFCYEASLKYKVPVSTEASSTQEHEADDTCKNEILQCQSIQCPYGVTRRVDNNNCERCSCYDPCENMICFQGSKCSVEHVQSRTETYEEVRFEAVCREVNKDGKCPPLSGEITKCDQECESDASCSGNQKCCYNGCAYVCVDPVTEKPPGQPAYNPPPKETGIPAAITDSDTTVEVEENDVANLVCKATGNPTPAIGWYKDGEQVDVASDGRFQLLLDYSLKIVNTRPSDAGTYRCVANNGIGTPDERDVELKILDPTRRPVDIIPPQDPSPVVSLGNPVILRCWSAGWPRPVFSWWRGNTMMPRTSEKYETLPLGGLRINYITIRDLGPYTCQAYNGEGRPATFTFIVRALGPLRVVSPSDKPFLQYIITPPRIPTFPPETTTTTTTTFPAYRPGERPYWPPYAKTPSEKPVTTTHVPEEPTNVRLRALIRTNTTKFSPFSDIVLPCEVQGYPPPSVYWYHNDKIVDPSERISISIDNTLKIKNAEESDAGTYKCEVRNQYGETSSTTTIMIEGVYVHPSCTDNPFFANCKLIVKAKYCTNTYYARFCCRSCTLAGQLPSFGTHLQDKPRRSKRK